MIISCTEAQSCVPLNGCLVTSTNCARMKPAGLLASALLVILVLVLFCWYCCSSGDTGAGAVLIAAGEPHIIKQMYIFKWVDIASFISNTNSISENFASMGICGVFSGLNTDQNTPMVCQPRRVRPIKAVCFSDAHTQTTHTPNTNGPQSRWAPN